MMHDRRCCMILRALYTCARLANGLHTHNTTRWSWTAKMTEVLESKMRSTSNDRIPSGQIIKNHQKIMHTCTDLNLQTSSSRSFSITLTLPRYPCRSLTKQVILLLHLNSEQRGPGYLYHFIRAKGTSVNTQSIWVYLKRTVWFLKSKTQASWGLCEKQLKEHPNHGVLLHVLYYVFPS